MVLWASKNVAGEPILLCVQFGKNDTEPEYTQEQQEEDYSDLPLTMWVTDLKNCWSTSFLPDALVQPTDPILSGPLPYSWFHFQKVFQKCFRSQNVTMSMTPSGSEQSTNARCSVEVKLNFDSLQPTFWKPRLETAPQDIVKKLGMLMYKCYKQLARKLSGHSGSEGESDSESEVESNSDEKIPLLEVEHDTSPDASRRQNLACNTPRRYRKKTAQLQAQAWNGKSTLEPDLPAQRKVQTRRKAPRFAAVGTLLIPSPRRAVVLPTFDDKKPFSPGAPCDSRAASFRRRQPSYTDDSSMECMKPSHLTSEEFTKEIQLRSMHPKRNTSPLVPFQWSASDDDDVEKSVVRAHSNSPPPTPPKHPRSPQVPLASRPAKTRLSVTPSLTSDRKDSKKDQHIPLLNMAGFTGRSPIATPSLSPITHNTTAYALDKIEASLSTLVSELFPDYSDAAQEQLCKVGTWEFNAFVLAKETNRPLYSVAYLLMHATGLVTKFAINDLKLQNFLSKVESLYQPNPYHNSIHACDVTQASWLLLQALVAHPVYEVRPVDFLCVLLAAVGHDIGHPGWNNHLEKAMKTERAMVYNDLSVLENFHTSALFKILSEPGCDVLCNMQPSEMSYVRTMVIGMILSTDVGQNVRFVDEVRDALVTVRNKEDVPCVESLRKSILCLCLKCADVSNPARERHVAVEWAERVIQEFHEQGDRERLLGLSITKFMDRYSHTETSTAECQIGFISGIVQPLYKLMDLAITTAGSQMLSLAEPALAYLALNLECWKQQEQESREVNPISLPEP